MSSSTERASRPAEWDQLVEQFLEEGLSLQKAEYAADLSLGLEKPDFREVTESEAPEDTEESQ